MKLTEEELNKLIADEVAKAAPSVDMEEVGKVIDNKLKEAIKPLDKKVVVGEDEDKKNPWSCMAEFAKAVAVAEKSRGATIDKRLLKVEVKTSLSEGDSEQGGYLVPTEFKNELLKVAVEKADIIGRCRKVPMATNSIQFPYLSGFDRSGGLIHGGVEFVWLDEEAVKTEKKPKFGKIELRLKECAAICKVSNSLLEDSVVSIEPILRDAFTDALAFQLDYVFINGSGAGQPLGLLVMPCLVTVAKETGQVAATIVFENIVKMYARLWRKGAGVWFANHDIFPQLATMSLAVGTGGVPVYLPANGASGRPYDTLMGLPIVWSEQMQTLGTVGDIALCDWSQYLVGQKAGAGAGLKFDTSIHLYFNYDQTAFRFTFRVDGQPWWPSALTPRHSAQTLSPFICLDTRS